MTHVVSPVYRIGSLRCLSISLVILHLQVGSRHPSCLRFLTAPLVTKTLTILVCFLDNAGYRDVPLLDRYFALLLEGTDVSFAEVIPCRPTSAYSFLYYYFYRPGFQFLRVSILSRPGAGGPPIHQSRHSCTPRQQLMTHFPYGMSFPSQV